MSQNYREENDRQRERSRQKEHYRHRENKSDYDRERDRDRKNRDKDRDRPHRDRHADSRRSHDHRSRAQRDTSGRQGNGRHGSERDEGRRDHRSRHSRRQHSRSISEERHKYSSRHSNFSGRPYSGSSGEQGRISSKRVQRELPIIRISNGNGGMVTEALDSIALYANSMLTKMLPVILKAEMRMGQDPLERVLNENHIRDLGALGKALKVLISELFPEQRQEREWNQYQVLDNNKISRRIRLPRQDGVNYFGLLIGPSGVSQKKMEMESGCKILVKGNLPNDKEEPHILIIGDSQGSVSKAEQLINGVLTADEHTRELIRDQQTRDAAEMGHSSYQTHNPLNSHLLTPYGQPGADAHIMTIPNDIVGLIIGKGGETIRQLQAASGAKIQVAKSDIPNTNERNVFIEGPPQKEQLAQKLINDIIIDHKKTQMHDQAMVPQELKRPDFFSKHTSQSYPIPLNLTGMVIGRGGDTLKNLMQRTGAIIEVPKHFNPTTGERILTLTGNQEVIDKAKKQISSLLSTAKYTKSPITGERQNLGGAAVRQQPVQVPQPRPPAFMGGMYPPNVGLYGHPMQPMAGYAGFQSQTGGFVQGGIDPK